MFSGTAALFRFVAGLALDDGAWLDALALLLLLVLPCGLVAGSWLHLALHGRGEVILGPDGLDVLLLGERKRCRWQEIADVTVIEDGARTVGVQVLIRMPSGVTSPWLAISDFYRIDHKALAQAIEAAREVALARESAPPAFGSAGEEIIASQTRYTHWLVGMVIYLPFALVGLYLLLR